MTGQKIKAKPGRKPSKPTEAQAIIDAVVDTQTQDGDILTPTPSSLEQPMPMGKRTPIHARKANGFIPREGFTARQVVEKPGRLEQFLDAGYVLAKGQERMFTQNAKGLDSACRAVVNKHNLSAGDAATAVWVEIPTELYEQDQQEKLKAQEAREAEIDPRQMEKNNPDVFYGSKFKKSYD